MRPGGIRRAGRRAGVIFVISGGFLSTPEQQDLSAPVAEPLLRAGFTIVHLRHPSTPSRRRPAKIIFLSGP